MTNITYVLKKLQPEELSILSTILALKKNEIEQITIILSKLLLPAKGLVNQPLKYAEIVNKIAAYHNVKLEEKHEIAREQELYLKLYQIEFDKLTEFEKENLIKEMEMRGLDKGQIASLTGVAAITAAQASGFGIYLLASSTVGALSSAVGVTLPFAFYSGMSSAISAVIGPIGWIVLSYALYRSFRKVRSLADLKSILSHSYKNIKAFFIGDYITATLCFKFIASMRIIVKARLEKEYQQLQASHDELLASETEINVFVGTCKVDQQIAEVELNDYQIKIREIQKNIQSLSAKIEEASLEQQALNKRIEEQAIALNQKAIEYKEYINTLQ